MRRFASAPAVVLAMAIGAGSLLGACGISGPVPSPACGGFHLLVVNKGPSALAVWLNGKLSDTVDGGTDRTIYQYGPGGVSAMPWTVTIVDPATGAVLATRDVTEASGDGAASIEVSAGSGGAPAVSDVVRSRGC